MNMQKTAVSAAIVTALGTAALTLPEPASAVLQDGNWIMCILPTATKTTTYGGTGFKIGRDGRYQSSFTFGTLPGSTSNGMTDNNTLVNGNGTATAGDTVAGQACAGRIVLSASGGSLTAREFVVDTIFATAGGDFAQYCETTDSSTTSCTEGNMAKTMTGSVDGSGNMTFTPTGRWGAINSPVMNDNRWNVDDNTTPGTTAWQSFSTSSATAAKGSINGAALTDAGDLNSDGVNDFSGVLVSGGQVGSDWGSFYGATYYEAWRVNIVTATTGKVTTAAVQQATDTAVDVSVGATGTNLSFSTSSPPASGTNCNVVSYSYPNVTINCSADGNFSYTLVGDDGVTDTKTVTVTVAAAGQPIAQDVTASVNQGTTVQITLDVTPDTGRSIVWSTLALGTPSGGGTVTNNSNGTVDYTPASGFVGTDTFTYTVDDDVGNTSTSATVTVTVKSAPQTSSGTYAPGSIASGAGSSDGRITADDIGTEDSEMALSCIGGCFDFTITGAADPTQVVLPLSAEVAEGYVYRKFMNGAWKDFDTSGSNTIASADISSLGGCPAPGDSSWVTWSGATAEAAHAGHRCLRLTLADNGGNDSDGTSGTISDPGGLANPPEAEDPRPAALLDSFKKNLSSGCTLGKGTPAGRLDLWLLLAGLAGLGVMRRKTRT